MQDFPSYAYRSIPLYSDVGPEEWNDWRWQMRNNIRDVETLSRVIPLDNKEKTDIEDVLKIFRMAITPYYASLIDPANKACPVRLQAVPRHAETHNDISDQNDPLHEDVDSPVPGLTHRYPDRVLLLVTHICSMNCRHCTRRRLVGSEDTHLEESHIDAAVEYIRKTPIIRDVLISGGDPFVLSRKTGDNHCESALHSSRGNHTDRDAYSSCDAHEGYERSGGNAQEISAALCQYAF
jgi:lysine 2,3-aminomutase